MTIHRRKDASPREGLKKYGDTVFADPVNKKYPIDTPGRIKAAWAYIHQPNNAAKYSAAEVRSIMTRIRQAAKARKLGQPDPDEFLELIHGRGRRHALHVWVIALTAKLRRLIDRALQRIAVTARDSSAC